MSDGRYYVNGTGKFHLKLACITSRSDIEDVESVGSDDVIGLDPCGVCVEKHGSPGNIRLLEQLDRERPLKARDIEGSFDQMYRVSDSENTGRKGHLYDECRLISHSNGWRRIDIDTDPDREICDLCHAQAILDGHIPVE